MSVLCESCLYNNITPIKCVTEELPKRSPNSLIMTARWSFRFLSLKIAFSRYVFIETNFYISDPKYTNQLSLFSYTWNVRQTKYSQNKLTITNCFHQDTGFTWRWTRPTLKFSLELLKFETDRWTIVEWSHVFLSSVFRTGFSIYISNISRARNS